MTMYTNLRIYRKSFHKAVPNESIQCILASSVRTYRIDWQNITRPVDFPICGTIQLEDRSIAIATKIQSKIHPPGQLRFCICRITCYGYSTALLLENRNLVMSPQSASEEDFPHSLDISSNLILTVFERSTIQDYYGCF